MISQDELEAWSILYDRAYNSFELDDGTLAARTKHLPERYAKRIQIRTDVHSQTGELLGTGKLRGSSKNSRHRNRRPRIGFGYRLRQPKVDNLSRSNTFPREANHNVARFDVPVNEVLSVDRGQTGGHLLHVHYAGPGCFACRVDRA